jgi:SAM-dependent methyltransferase
MNWKWKAAIQNACARLPRSDAVYYAIRWAWGDLHTKPDPMEMLAECARLCALLRDAGVKMDGARILEVGTGWRIDMPLGFYLAGAGSTLTLDLHRILKPAMVMAALERMRANRETVRGCFSPVTEAGRLERRLNALLSCTRFEEVLERTCTEYRAPADAAATGLPAGSIDIHVSYTVFEHIPAQALTSILREGARLLAAGGVALHHIDLSDHFAHADARIPPINFLQFSEPAWRRYAGNRFAYHNRLRPGAYEDIYRAGGHQVVRWIPSVDRRSLEALRNGFALDAAFRGAQPEALCTTALLVLSRPQ